MEILGERETLGKWTLKKYKFSELCYLSGRVAASRDVYQLGEALRHIIAPLLTFLQAYASLQTRWCVRHRC